MIRLLLVEDDVDVANVLAEILTKQYQEPDRVDVFTVHRADDAVYQVLKFDWDLVLMDIGLTPTPTPPLAGMEEPTGPPPGFDGTLTALAIRGLGGEHGAVPIVAISGGLHPTDEALMELAGLALVNPESSRFPDRYALRKPVLPSVLFEAIDNFRRRALGENTDIEEGGAPE